MLDLPGVEEEGPDGPRREGGVVPAGLEPTGSCQEAQLDLPGVEEEGPDGPQRRGGVVPAGLEPVGSRQ